MPSRVGAAVGVVGGLRIEVQQRPDADAQAHPIAQYASLREQLEGDQVAMMIIDVAFVVVQTLDREIVGKPFLEGDLEGEGVLRIRPRAAKQQVEIGVVVDGRGGWRRRRGRVRGDGAGLAATRDVERQGGIDRWKAAVLENGASRCGEVVRTRRSSRKKDGDDTEQ